jgi:hypothetical protein
MPALAEGMSVEEWAAKAAEVYPERDPRDKS